jgi:transposase
VDTIEMNERAGAARTKRQYTEEFKAKVLSECEEPGASIAQVALRHGINANLVHNWRAVHRRQTALEQPSSSRMPLIPVTVAMDAAEEPKQRTADGKVGAGIEIALHGAWLTVGPGVDAKLLRSVVRILHEILG